MTTCTTVSEIYAEKGVLLWEDIPEDHQERILYKEREYVCQDTWWSECIIDDWNERLEQLGFLDAEIQFCGFGSQGDGASFTAHIDLQMVIDSLIM